MRDQLEQRLQALRAELESGERLMADLDTRKASLHDTLLRIGGAVQVLEEELARPPYPERYDTTTAAD
jgi:hypothetical protein